MGVRTREWLQQELKLGWESGRGDWPFFELAISNIHIFNDQSRIQTSHRVSSDKIISHVAKGGSEGCGHFSQTTLSEPPNFSNHRFCPKKNLSSSNSPRCWILVDFLIDVSTLTLGLLVHEHCPFISPGTSCHRAGFYILVGLGKGLRRLRGSLYLGYWYHGSLVTSRKKGILFDGCYTIPLLSYKNGANVEDPPNRYPASL
mgnify:CR=1 FL=1